MALSEWDWLSLLVFLVLLLVAIMSWPNNSNPNHLNPHRAHPSSQAQPTTPANVSGSQLAPTTSSAIRRPQFDSSQSPSMDLSLPATQPTVSFPTTADEHAYIATLLQHAHASMAQQKPMQALGLVLAAVRQQRGEEGVFDVLNETREGFGLKAHANPVRQQREAQQQHNLQAMDDGMAALSLQSAIGQLQSQLANSGPQLPSGGGSYEDAEMADESDDEYDDEGEYEEVEESIVDEGLVDKAVRAGTHVQCRACGGVIARTRMQAHAELWCEANDSTHSQEHG